MPYLIGILISLLISLLLGKMLIFLASIAFLLLILIGGKMAGGVSQKGKIKNLLPFVEAVVLIVVALAIIFGAANYWDNVPKTEGLKEGEWTEHSEYFFNTKGIVTYDASLIGTDNISVYINKEQEYARFYEKCSVWWGVITIPSSSSDFDFYEGSGYIKFYFVPQNSDATFQSFETGKIRKPEGYFALSVNFGANKIEIRNRATNEVLWSYNLDEINWDDVEVKRAFIVIPDSGESIRFQRATKFL